MLFNGLVFKADPSNTSILTQPATHILAVERSNMTAISLSARAHRGLLQWLRWAALLSVIAGVMTAGAPAAAQQLDEDVEALLGRIHADPESYETQPVPASTIDPVSLDVHWRLFKRSLSDEQVNSQELEVLARDAASLGQRNLPSHATAVYALITTKMAEGAISAKEADKLYLLAAQLSPDLPYPLLAHSGHLMRHDLSRFPAATSLATAGLKQGYQWLDTRVAWALKLSALGLLAGLGAMLLFLFAQLLRNFGIICYDAARVLPRGFSSNQTVILIVALTVVPGLLLRSPLLSVLLLLGFLSIVQNLNERLVTLLIFGLLIALPGLDRKMSAQITWPQSEAQQRYHEQYLRCDDECQNNLAQSWLDSEDDALLTYSAAMMKFRDGTPENLSLADKMLQEQDRWPGSMRAPMLNLRGAAMVAQAKPEEAIEHLNQARTSDSSAVKATASFNLMRAYQMKDDRDSARSALQDAIQTDLDAVRNHLGLQRRDVNSFLLVQPLAPETFWQRHLANQDESVSITGPIWRALAGPVFELEHAPLAGGIGAVLVLLGLPLYLTRRTSTPCPNCGLARDPADAEVSDEHRYCLPCYQTFVSGATLEYAARTHNERILGRRERFQDGSRRLLSLLLPGTGHCQAGRGLFGFLTIFITLLGAAILWRPMGIWRPAAELFTENWAGQQTIAWLLISIGVAIGLSGALRGIRPAQPSGRAKTRRGPQ